MVKSLDFSQFSQTSEVVRSHPDAAPGVAIGVWIAPRRGRLEKRYMQAWGNSSLIPEVRALSLDQYFDLASLSKVVATATLTARLVEMGRLSWSTPVQQVLADFPNPSVTVAHLLSHTSGLPAWLPFWETLRSRAAQYCLSGLEACPRARRMEWMRELLGKVDCEVAPEKRVLYSDLSFLWLGFVLEKLTGVSLEHAVRRWVWAPLGVARGGLHYRTGRPKLRERIQYVATENCPWRNEVLQGQVHDDNCWSMGGVAGHAGVFGRVGDVLDFASKLLTTDFLTAATKRAMWSRVASPLGCERTLGWDTPHLGQGGSSAGKMFSGWTVGHLGFTGTSLWIDVHRQVVITVLTNRVHPTREGGSKERIGAFRPLVHDAIWRDLAELSLLGP